MGGDSGSESGEIMRNIMKAEPCTTIETRVGDISAGKVGCADLRGLDQHDENTFPKSMYARNHRDAHVVRILPKRPVNYWVDFAQQNL